MAAASRATGAHPCLALTPAERAAVAAELAGLSARVANLAARLERLHTALAAPGPCAGTTPMAAAPITGASAVRAGRVAPGLVTATKARPWR
jgi:hypothetical protein